MKKILLTVLLTVLVLTAITVPVLAAAQPTNAAAETAEVVEAEQKEDVTSSKAYAAGIAIAVVAAAAAIGMGLAIAKSSEAISRQPEAAGNIRTGLLLGLVFIETAIIYALIVAILIIFVL